MGEHPLNRQVTTWAESGGMRIADSDGRLVAHRESRTRITPSTVGEWPGMLPQHRLTRIAERNLPQSSVT